MKESALAIEGHKLPDNSHRRIVLFSLPVGFGASNELRKAKANVSKRGLIVGLDTIGSRCALLGGDADGSCVLAYWEFGNRV